MTEFYVPREVEMNFIRNDKDLARFAETYRKKVVRQVEANEAPQFTEVCYDEFNRPFKAHIHAVNGNLLNVSF